VIKILNFFGWQQYPRIYFAAPPLLVFPAVGVRRCWRCRCWCYHQQLTLFLFPPLLALSLMAHIVSLFAAVGVITNSKQQISLEITPTRATIFRR